MKVLVFDDSPIHRSAAAVQLKDHDLTVVSTYDEAEKALTPSFNYQEYKRILAEAGYEEYPRLQGEERDKFEAFKEAARKQATTYPDFDVVLTDLLVPASGRDLNESNRLIGQEMPLGTIIAFLALRWGVKYVAVVSDAGNHSHPASSALTALCADIAEGLPVIIGDTTVMLTNYDVTTEMDAETFEEVSFDFLLSEEGRKKYPRIDDGHNGHRGMVRAKVWGEILERLLEGKLY